jgi:hypothetical protein
VDLVIRVAEASLNSSRKNARFSFAWFGALPSTLTERAIRDDDDG